MLESIELNPFLMQLSKASPKQHFLFILGHFVLEQHSGIALQAAPSVTHMQHGVSVCPSSEQQNHQHRVFVKYRPCQGIFPWDLIMHAWAGAVR